MHIRHPVNQCFCLQSYLLIAHLKGMAIHYLISIVLLIVNLPLYQLSLPWCEWLPSWIFGLVLVCEKGVISDQYPPHFICNSPWFYETPLSIVIALLVYPSPPSISPSFFPSLTRYSLGKNFLCRTQAFFLEPNLTLYCLISCWAFYQ